MMRDTKQRTRRLAALAPFILLLAACSGGADEATADEAAPTTMAASVAFGESAEAPAESVGREEVPDDGALRVSYSDPTRHGQRIIRNGRVDVRVETGTFGTAAASLRSIAEDLGGFLAEGESHLETIDEQIYTVGWFTVRVPESRFEDALARVENLGERLTLSLSSQDVTEEYVDLEGRLRYWRNQEAFYARLLDEADTVQDLVTIQTQMQSVLLNIEQIEGRLSYLDDRTTFSTLTVGLTEVPGAVPPPEDLPSDPGIIEQAIEQAGAVLLGTVGFLIVAGAFLLPVAMIALVGLAVFRVVLAAMRRPRSSEG